ncbi:uncharacterized protein LOC117680197 isoform X1 [Pantherophis guttatus]|uniref:Uncharacterized protein LOC117680197 isoform X1 n=1 Tax=Pantherophis guttatus TaxID=94885 RepID=A0A6P9E1X5_PANGU|nr:uncharacterized protein LOC117680197 isoform X1 [Pantherophis guttatus]
MPRRLDKFLQIAPHSLAIVLSPCGGDEAAPPEQAAARAQREGDDAGGEAGQGSRAEGEPAADSELGRHHIGYEIFADFKQGNMQHFWNKKVTAAVAETFFLGWIDEQVLLIQGKEEHLEALREGWMRRALKPPAGFQIKCLEVLAEEQQYEEVFLKLEESQMDREMEKHDQRIKPIKKCFDLFELISHQQV